MTIQAGQTIANVGMKLWEDIIKSQATNEVAEARGQVNTLIESFATFVVDNPNASPEEIEAEQSKISTQIKALSGTLKTGLGKSEFTNFLAANEGVINQRMFTQAAAIKSKQELARSEVIIKNHKVNFEYEELVAHYEEQVQNGVYDRETIFGPEDEGGGRLDIEIAAMRATEKKIQLEQAKTAALITAQSFRTEEGEIDLKAGQDFIKNSPNVPDEIRLDVLRDLNTWNAQEQQALDQQREVDRNEINNQMYKDLDFDKAVETIDASSLNEKEQGQKMKEARDLQLLWAKGGRDEKQEKIKSDLLVKISKNPRKYNEDFLSDEALAGRIHPSHLPQLKLWRDKVIKGATGDITAKKGYKLLEAYNKRGVFGKGADGANLYIEVTDNFTEFLLEEDRSAQEVTEYIENMTPELGFWEEFWRPRGFEKKLRAGKIRELTDIETERLAETEGIEEPIEQQTIIDPAKEPATREEFIDTANSITDPTNKRLYVDKWLRNF